MRRRRQHRPECVYTWVESSGVRLGAKAAAESGRFAAFNPSISGSLRGRVMAGKREKGNTIFGMQRNKRKNKFRENLDKIKQRLTRFEKNLGSFREDLNNFRERLDSFRENMQREAKVIMYI